MYNKICKRTRLRDKDSKIICVGDILHVEGYPNKNVDGSLDYEGVVEMEGNKAVCTYYDIGVRESSNIADFPKEGREVLNEQERHNYWKTQFLGEEPPEYYYKEELYKKYFAGLLDMETIDNESI